MGDTTAQVWWASREDYRPDLTRYFDQTERARFENYRTEGGRQRFALGCALAKAVAAELTGGPVALDRTCTECGAAHGKPRVVGADLELSVSHSGDAAVVAVAGAPCGVDVEQLSGGSRDVAALAGFVLAESEHAADETRFLRLWTRKEAVTKATGDGLRVPFSKVVLGDDPPRVLSWPYPDPPESATLLDLQAPEGYLAALAVLGPVSDVVSHHGSVLIAR
jgi:4'-phosphopantetheinyl transferase